MFLCQVTKLMSVSMQEENITDVAMASLRIIKHRLRERVCNIARYELLLTSCFSAFSHCTLIADR